MRPAQVIRLLVSVGILLGAWFLCRSAFVSSRHAIADYQVIRGLSTEPVRFGFGADYTALPTLARVGGCVRTGESQLWLATTGAECPMCGSAEAAVLSDGLSPTVAIAVFVVGTLSEQLIALTTAACAQNKPVALFKVESASTFRNLTGITVLPTVLGIHQDVLLCALSGEIDLPMLSACTDPGTGSTVFRRGVGALPLGLTGLN